jgi:phosphatidate cytidylyltransferase
MLKARVHTAIFLVIGFLALLFLASNDVWAFVTLIATLIATWEWGKLIGLTPIQNQLLIVTTAIAGFVLNATRGYAANDVAIMSLLGLSVVFWLLCAPLWLTSLKKVNNRFFMALLGIVLMLAMWLGLITLHLKGAVVILLLLATIWLADSAAYFAGKKFGNRKLAPNVSPGKTWEGVIGALIAVTFYGAIICYVFAIDVYLIIFLWLLVALSIIGDLLESLLKRQAGVKDSSDLLPGHGGVLDRIDGVLPTVSFTAFCVLLIQYLVR